MLKISNNSNTNFFATKLEHWMQTLNIFYFLQFVLSTQTFFKPLNNRMAPDLIHNVRYVFQQLNSHLLYECMCASQVLYKAFVSLSIVHFYRSLSEWANTLNLSCFMYSMMTGMMYILNWTLMHFCSNNA